MNAPRWAIAILRRLAASNDAEATSSSAIWKRRIGRVSPGAEPSWPRS